MSLCVRGVRVFVNVCVCRSVCESNPQPQAVDAQAWIFLYWTWQCSLLNTTTRVVSTPLPLPTPALLPIPLPSQLLVLAWTLPVADVRGALSRGLRCSEHRNFVSIRYTLIFMDFHLRPEVGHGP